MKTCLKPEEVVSYLLKVSGCRDRDDLLDFACTLSVAPGANGHNGYQVESAKKSLTKGEVPVILLSWYRVVRPIVHTPA